jgi:DNA-directed RNA polymerase subunit RPC12/RpoP
VSVQKLNQGNGPFSKIKWVSETENDFVGRCPFCGDSVKNKNHAHFHVGKRYPVYHCFRCGAKGFIKSLETFLNEHCSHEYVYTLTYDLPSLDVGVVQNHLNEILDAFSILLSKDETNYFAESVIM